MAHHVTVFCSASPKKNTEHYLDMAYRFGRYLARQGYHCVNGGTAGMMKELSRGCREAGGIVHCVTLAQYQLDHDQYDKHDEHIKLSPRQSQLIECGDAYVALPGGIGTLHEVFQVLAEKSVGEIPHTTPLICVGEVYDMLVALLWDVEERGLARDELDELITFVADIEMAGAVLEQYFSGR